MNENPGSNNDNLIIAASSLQSLLQRAQDEIRNYHQTFPLRHGIPREELKSRLKLAQREFIALISFWLLSGGLKGGAAWLALPEHQVKYSAVQQQKIMTLMNKFETAPFNPPGIKECIEEVGLDVVNALLEDETLIKTTEDVVFRTKDMNKMKDWVVTTIRGQGMITVANFRDNFQTSRKYALAVLEYLDRIGFTVREGDNRRLVGK